MDNDTIRITKNAAETKDFGKTLAVQLMGKKFHGPLIVALYGDLGSGKTTFIQGFARGLGLTTRLLSPTFIIVRRYPVPETSFFFHHIDLYRMENITDMKGLGLGELFTDPVAIIVIEWAERLGTLLPEKRMDIRFEVISKNERKIFLEVP